MHYHNVPNNSVCGCMQAPTLPVPNHKQSQEPAHPYWPSSLLKIQKVKKIDPFLSYQSKGARAERERERERDVRKEIVYQL